jgi:hypothetical protein
MECTPRYTYGRYFLENRDDDALLQDLEQRLFRPNMETPNDVIRASERHRMQKLMQRYGVEFDPELFGYDWDKLSYIVAKLRGMVYNHVPVVMPDLYAGQDMDEFVEHTALPKGCKLPEDLDVFVTSMTSMRMVKERPSWVTRYGLFNQRRMGQTVQQPHEQQATRTGFWMIPHEVLERMFDADADASSQAFRIFCSTQFAEGHDGFFHMPIHGIYRENPHYSNLRAWSDLLYDVPEEIKYPNGSTIPNYEMAAVRSHRNMYRRALTQNPKLDDILIHRFEQYTALVEQTVAKMQKTDDAAACAKYMMTLAKTPLFHVIDPDTEDPRIRAIAERHPCITKNNKMMRALHATDHVHTTQGQIPVQEVIDQWRDAVTAYAEKIGLVQPSPDLASAVEQIAVQGEKADASQYQKIGV